MDVEDRNLEIMRLILSGQSYSLTAKDYHIGKDDVRRIVVETFEKEYPREHSLALEKSVENELDDGGQPSLQLMRTYYKLSNATISIRKLSSLSRSKVVLIAATAIFVLAGIFPNYRVKSHVYASSQVKYFNVGRSFVFLPPKDVFDDGLNAGADTYFIDYWRLLMEWTLIVVPTVVLLFLLKKDE